MWIIFMCPFVVGRNIPDAACNCTKKSTNFPKLRSALCEDINSCSMTCGRQGHNCCELGFEFAENGGCWDVKTLTWSTLVESECGTPFFCNSSVLRNDCMKASACICLTDSDCQKLDGYPAKCLDGLCLPQCDPSPQAFYMILSTMYCV